MPLPNTGEKRVYFFHEIEINESDAYQRSCLQFEEWEERMPFKTMKLLFDENKCNLTSKLESLQKQYAFLEDAIKNDRNLNRTAAKSKMHFLDNGINHLKDQISKLSENLSRKDNNNHLIIDEAVPDMYPVAYVVSDQSGNSSAGSPYDNIVGIFTVKYGLVYKRKGVINGREKSMKEFFVVPYTEIFKSSNEPRIDILDTNEDNAAIKNEHFLNQSRFYQNNNTTFVGRIMNNGEIKSLGSDSIGYVDNKGYRTIV